MSAEQYLPFSLQVVHCFGSFFDLISVETAERCPFFVNLSRRLRRPPVILYRAMFLLILLTLLLDPEGIADPLSTALWVAPGLLGTMIHFRRSADREDAGLKAFRRWMDFWVVFGGLSTLEGFIHVGSWWYPVKGLGAGSMLLAVAGSHPPNKMLSDSETRAADDSADLARSRWKNLKNSDERTEANTKEDIEVVKVVKPAPLALKERKPKRIVEQIKPPTMVPPPDSLVHSRPGLPNAVRAAVPLVEASRALNPSDSKSVPMKQGHQNQPSAVPVTALASSGDPSQFSPPFPLSPSFSSRDTGGGVKLHLDPALTRSLMREAEMALGDSGDDIAIDLDDYAASPDGQLRSEPHSEKGGVAAGEVGKMSLEELLAMADDEAFVEEEEVGEVVLAEGGRKGVQPLLVK